MAESTDTDNTNTSQNQAVSHVGIPEAFAAGIRDVWENKIVFNKVIGLEVTHMSVEEACADMPMKDDLVGHFLTRRIHGGAIAAAVDAMGGLAVMLAMVGRYPDESPQELIARFQGLGTIDLRVDYLRPGIESERYHISAKCIKLGSRVANSHMEFTADDGRLIATGTGAYIVS